MNRAQIVVALALVPLNTDEEIRFIADEERTLVKTFEVVFDIDSDRDSSGSSSSWFCERRVVITDRIQAIEAERIARLERTYDEVSASIKQSFELNGTSKEFGFSGSSELAGATVIFDWAQDLGEYSANSDNVSDELLEGLAFDLDFTALLPQAKVSEGDQWKLDPETYEKLMNAWYELPWEWEGDTHSDDTSSSSAVGDDIEPGVGEEKDGEVFVTFKGVRELDSVPFAILDLEGRIETERIVNYGSEDMPYTSHSIEVREVSGEGLWNLKNGHLHSLEVNVERSSTRTSFATDTVGQEESKNTDRIESRGTTTLVVVFEEV